MSSTGAETTRGYNRGVPAIDRRSRRQRESADPVARYLGALKAEVMDTFWRRESATVREVVDELNTRRPLAYTTVLTLVTRLWERGLLAREPEGRGFRYRATKTRDQVLGELSDELIDRLFHDFGEIAVARLGERLEQLDSRSREKLSRARRERDGTT
jgi:predicted transcriptional regulator